jgi:epoxyqueuosine reductase
VDQSQTPLEQSLKQRLETYSVSCGFVRMGICRPDAIPQAAARLADYVAQGRHGDMGWMADRMGWRGDPAALWPQAKSVIMLAEAYTPQHDPLAVLNQRDHAAISVYAHGRDYHDLVKKRLKTVGRWLIDQVPDAEIKVFVDTAPVMEKPLAQAAGLGWQGKHTNLLGRDLGNWVFLGAIFTTVELELNRTEISHCGSCTACLDICPTQAFPAPYQLDARRCISYLTIEHKGPVPTELRTKLGNRIYGCDDCLAICPWNKFAAAATELRYLRQDGPPKLADLVTLDDAAFRDKFAGSPVKRIGRDRFVRNVLYAIGNSGDRELAVHASALTHDPDPTVADAAAWAIERLK